jgi:hypothetical protein
MHMASSGDPNLPPVSELTGLDGMFAKTNIVLLILFGFCCGQIALILGIVGLVACKDPRAKQNALIVTIIAVVEWVIAVIAVLSGNLLNR